KMVPASLSRYLVGVMAGCWKYPLPHPLFPRVWVLALKGVGQGDSASDAIKIALVLLLYQIKVLGERFFHCSGKHCVAVLIPFASANYDLVSGEINVLDSEPQAFHQSQARSVEQHGH